MSAKRTTVPVYQEGSTEHVFRSPISQIDVPPEFDLNDQMRVRYSYLGQEFTKPVILQFRNYDSGYENQETTRAWFEMNGVLVDEATKKITFPGTLLLND